MELFAKLFYNCSKSASCTSIRREKLPENWLDALLCSDPYEPMTSCQNKVFGARPSFKKMSKIPVTPTLDVGSLLARNQTPPSLAALTSTVTEKSVSDGNVETNE
jgi:hypothetical protein